VTLEGYYGPLPRRLVMVNDSKGSDPRDTRDDHTVAVN